MFTNHRWKRAKARHTTPKEQQGQEARILGKARRSGLWLTIDAKDGVIKTAEHEAMHLRMEAEPGLRERLIDALGLSQEQRDKLARKYYEAYDGCYIGEDLSAYLDEIVCDAYAGINRMGLGADKLQSSVRAAADSTASQRTKKPAQTRGPPEAYSINNTRGESVKEQFKQYRANGLTKHDEFYFGTLAREYDALGITGQPLVMSQTTYKKSKSEKHNVPQRVFNNLESIMQQPVLSFEIGNSVGVLTDEIDGDGKPLLVGVLKDAELDGETVTRIKSIYGLDNPKEWIANQIKEGKELRIYDDKKADSFLNGFGYKAGRAENYRLGDIVQSVEENVKGKYSPEMQERAPELTDADAPVLSEEEQQRETWRQMTREVDTEGERLREMERRGKQYMKQLRDKSVRELAAPMSAAGAELERKIKPEIDSLIDTYLRTGRLREKKIEHAFERVYSEAKRMNQEFAERYATVQGKIRQTAITLTAEQKAGMTNAVANEQEVRAKALKDLYIVPSGGVEVGELYSKMRDAAPELFPAQKTEAWQQIMQLSTVSRRIAKAEILTAETKSSNPQYFKDNAWETFKAGVLELKPRMREAKEYAQAYEREQTAAREEMLRREEETAREDERRREEEAAAEQEAFEPYDYDKLPGKARAFVDQAVNSAVRQAANAMSIPGKAKREVLKPAVQGMMNEFLKTGKIAQETINKSFEDAYDAGIEEDREFYDTFKHIKGKLLKTGIRVTPEVRAEFADLEQFRRAVRGKILLNNEGIGIDTLYGELHDEAPGLFPEAIMNQADQLMRMIEVADKIQITKQTLDAKRDGKTLAEWEAVVRELWEKNPGIRKEKVERAVGEFRRIYDELFTQMNDVRVRNGYEPIDYRKGYFPHFQPGQTDGVLAVMGKALGIKADVTALGTSAWYAAINMIYSDYCAAAREYGVDRPGYYAKMARAFLMDRDGGEAEKKIEAYDRCVAKG